MRAFSCPKFRFAASLCMILACCMQAFGLEGPDGGTVAAVKTAAVAPKPTAGEAPVSVAGKIAATRLNLKKRIDRQPLVFFPVQDGGSETRFAAARPDYSMTLGDSSLVLTSHQRIAAAAPEKKPEADPGNGSSARPATVQEKTSSVKVEFLGTDEHAKIEGQGEAPGYANFFTGSDPAKWRSHVAGFNRVRYTGLYPGIDLIYYGETHRRLEYDLVVAPGADPQAIRLKVSGDRKARIGENGDLELDGPDGVMRLDRPFLYQSLDHGKRAIAGQFVQLAENEFGFKTGDYDTARPLVIDPKINLVYATYAGGIHDDEADDLVLDANGAAYVTGYTASQDFPVSGNAIQLERQNIGTYTYDAFLSKFDASGTLIFSTFLGGSNTDQARAVQLDSAGNILMGGYTSSSDFPVTSNAYQKTFGGYNDAFLAKISNDGSQLIYSTYLGGSGSEAINRMRVNTDGTFWVVGDASADGLPVSATAVQQHTLSTADGFVAKMSFDANGNLLIPALTFLGGSNTSGETGLISDLDLDSAGNIYVTGATQSSDFPTTANAFMKAFPLSGGCYNSPQPNEAVFITKFSPDLSQMLYSTVVGGKTEDQNGYPVCNQYGKTIHVDQTTGNIWLVGSTGMSDFPVTSNAISSKLNGNGYAGVDSFVFELSADGTKQLFGTYLGGSQFDYGGAAAWDASGNIWIAGPTQSTDYPVTASTALQPANAGGYDTFLTELSPDGSKILYATYLGGSGDDDISSGNRIRLDAVGNIHMAGETNSANYPVTATAAQMLYANGDANPDTADAYYAILGTGAIGTVGPIVGGNNGDTSITVQGAGFQTGATCSLVQGTKIIASATVVINPTGTGVTCDFSLSGAATGSYDVVIINPDGTAFTKTGGFTVEAGAGPQIWLNVIGRPAVRFNTPTTFTVSYGNSGDTDAIAVPIFISVPSGATVTLLSPELKLPTLSDFDPNQLPSSLQINGATVIPILIPRIAPGTSGSVQISLTVPSTSSTFEIDAYNWLPFAQSKAALAAADKSNALTERLNAMVVPALVHPRDIDSGAAVNCIQDLIQLGLSIGAGIIPGGGCVTASAGLLNSIVGSFLSSSQPGAGDNLGYNIGGILASGGQAAINCIAAGAGATPVGLAVNTALAIAGAGLQGVQAVKDCNMAAMPMNPQMKGGGGVGAVDPNYKAGPLGDGSKSQFVGSGKAFSYALGFENEPTATAPASQVVVTDKLDPTKVDLTTLSLGAVSFGSTVINLPPNTTNYSTMYKISSTLSLRIAASLDTATSTLKWTLTSIDPSTGQPPTDPTVGFLPPDKDGTVGQGSVIFSVMPKAGQSTGAAINNMASVVFDSNAAINTPVWSNTLDLSAPVSSVTALPARTLAGAFTVSWSGTDVGSGIAGYNVFSSDNGGAYSLFQQNVKTTSASFTGVVGHTYAFYTISTDGAGNMEAAKTKPDTSTNVVAQLTPLTTTTTLTSSSTSIGVGSGVMLTAVVATPTGTTQIPTGTVTFMNGTATLGMVSLDATGKAVLSTTTLPVGTASVTATYGGDNSFAGSASTAVSITVGTPTETVSLGSSSLTVTNGSSVSTTVTVGSTFGFSSAATLSCSGLPANSSCSFSPATVTPTSTASASSTLTIATTSRSAALVPVQMSDHGGRIAFAFLLPCLLTPLAFAGRRLRGSRLLAVLLMAGVFAVLSGCGGSSPTVSNKGTPAGVSTVTVTATAGAVTQSVTLQLTVN